MRVDADEVVGAAFILFVGLVILWYWPMLFLLISLALAGGFAISAFGHRHEQSNRKKK